MSMSGKRISLFVKLATLAFICFCAVSLIQISVQYNGMVGEQNELREKIDDCNDSIEQLSDQLARPFDDEYVKSVAREKLNYRMPDEIIFYNDLQR